jgi:small-conductance mechanosensitive channel
VGFLLASMLSTRVRGEVDGTGRPQPWRGTLAQMTGYLIRALSVAMALQVAGVDVGTVLAASAVLAVGIGIAMQKVAENFVSGVILMTERSIREGDVIEFDATIARVRHMGIRSTIVRTLDDEEIIVPNSILTQAAVKNLTLTDTLYRLRVRVGVSYGSDLAKVEEVLRIAGEELTWREKGQPPRVFLLDFGNSSVDFEVSVWTRDVWTMRRGQSDLRKAIWQGFKDAGITIPFPQMDVHFDRETVGAVEAVAASHKPAKV